MFIKTIILQDYNRMKSNSFIRLEYKPTSNVQIILGTNGYGKSSLVAELSPLPADLNRFYGDNGYKEIHIDHNNKEYVLISNKKTGKHIFKCMDVNLNEGGTRKVQLQLVEEHFNITPDIHEVLLGNVEFTDMPVSVRKKWFRRISNVDYTYGLKIYDKIKVEYRDIIGGIKLLNNRLSTTKSSMLDNNTLNELNTRSKELREFIDYLLTNKMDEVNVNEVTIDTNTLKTVLGKDKQVLVTNANDVSLSIRLANERLTKNKDAIKTNIDLLEELNNKKSSINTIDKSSLDTLTASVKDLTTTLGTNVLMEDLSTVSDILKTYKSKYMEDIIIVKNNTDTDGIQRYNELRSELDKKNIALTNAKIVLQRLIATEEEMSKNKTNDDIECKKCGNIWTLNYDVGNHDIVLNKISKADAEVKSLEDIVGKMTIRLDSIGNVKSSIDNIHKLIVLLPDYVYNNIINGITIDSDMNILDNRLTKLYSIVLTVKDLPKLKNELDTLHVTINMQKEVTDNNVNDLDSSISKVTSRLDKLYRYSSRLNTILSVNKKLLNDITIRDKVKEDFKLYIDSIDKISESERIKRTNTYIDAMITNVRDDLSFIDKQISTHNFNTMTVNNIRADLLNLTLRKEALGVVMKALSPTGGLIGKSISGYLEYFTSKMNVMVNSLWSYRLTISPCSIEDGDLDYRFPYNSDDKVFGKDVSKMSSSMKEVVNLAFKLTSMESLGLEDYPLYLDEYASSFDPTHRLNAYDRVEELADKYSQMYIISHYSEVFGRFKDADIVVISKDNLFLDDIKEYNTNIIYS